MSFLRPLFLTFDRQFECPKRYCIGNDGNANLKFQIPNSKTSNFVLLKSNFAGPFQKCLF